MSNPLFALALSFSDSPLFCSLDSLLHTHTFSINSPPQDGHYIYELGDNLTSRCESLLVDRERERDRHEKGKKRNAFFFLLSSLRAVLRAFLPPRRRLSPHDVEKKPFLRFSLFSPPASSSSTYFPPLSLYRGAAASECDAREAEASFLYCLQNFLSLFSASLPPFFRRTRRNFFFLTLLFFSLNL